MREKLAKAVAALLTGLVVLLAAFFADRRNVVDAPTAGDETADVAEASPDPALVARGRVVFEEQSCARCHAAEGRGNPRSPLDGVGARRSGGALRDWVTASGSAGDRLPRTTVRAKEGFAELPADDLDALVEYLSSLR